MRWEEPWSFLPQGEGTGVGLRHLLLTRANQAQTMLFQQDQEIWPPPATRPPSWTVTPCPSCALGLGVCQQPHLPFLTLTLNGPGTSRTQAPPYKPPAPARALLLSTFEPGDTHCCMRPFASSFPVPQDPHGSPRRG